MHNLGNNGTGLARRLGLLAATMTGLGVIIGSGIYVIIGAATKQAGNAIWLSFLFAALGASLTALSYARLGRLRPKNAPEYQFVNMAFGKRLAFLAGWLILLAQIVSASAVALGFAGYLHALLNVPELPAAIVLILFSCLILYVGITQSATLAIILTLTEISGLLIIIVIGLPHLGQVSYTEMPAGFMGTLSAASLVFFAYLGFEGMANLSEEMKEPEKNLPRAILLALGLSTVFYVLVAISAVSVVGWERLSQSSAPLAVVAEQALGSNAGLVLSLISLAATANTVLILLLSGSRILHAMSCSKVLPGALCVVSKKRNTPWLAIIVVGIVSSLFASFRSVQQVAEFTNFITLLAFIGVNASAIRLLNQSTAHSSYKYIILNRVVPIMGIFVSAWLAVNTGMKAAIFGGIIIIVGFLIYWLTNSVLRKSN